MKYILKLKILAGFKTMVVDSANGNNYFQIRTEDLPAFNAEQRNAFFITSWKYV